MTHRTKARVWFFATAFLLGFTLLMQRAHAAPPADALFGAVNGTPTAAYSADSQLGTCLYMDAQIGTAWTTFWQRECGIQQSTLDAQGGATGYITYMLPDFNAGLQAYFGGGTGVIGQINTSLRTSFKFSGTTLAPR